MATKTCPSCGAEYIASVIVCPDCDVDLVESEDVESAPDESGGQVAYELHEWSGEARTMIEQLVAGQSIPHAWEGTTLVVPSVLESDVDELIEQVEATTLASLDPDADKVVYELSEWSPADAERLASTLDEAGVPHEFDLEGNLVVLEGDEDRVEELFDSIEYPDALKPDLDGEAPEELDGLDVPELLGDLFVAADRLRKHARDHEGVLGLVAAAGHLAGTDVPFGFAPAVWTDIKGRTERLAEGLESDGLDDEDIEARADELRGLLREYV